MSPDKSWHFMYIIFKSVFHYLFFPTIIECNLPPGRDKQILPLKGRCVLNVCVSRNVLLARAPYRVDIRVSLSPMVFVSCSRVLVTSLIISPMENFQEEGQCSKKDSWPCRPRFVTGCKRGVLVSRRDDNSLFLFLGYILHFLTNMNVKYPENSAHVFKGLI